MLITGHPRSGTTLLHRICNGHPDVRLTKEFGCFRLLGVPLSLYSLGILGRCWASRANPIWIPSGTSHISQLFMGYAFQARFLAFLYRWRPPLVVASDIERALRHLIPDTRIVGDKFTDYVFNLNQFVDIEGMAVVVIYRDCRDVVASYLERVRGDWRKTPVLSAFNTAQTIAERWLSAVGCIQRHQQKICAIRYEDLVQTPQSEVEKLGRLLGVDPNGFYVDCVRPSSVGSYISRLSEEELSTVMRIAGPKLIELGYS